MSLCPKLYRRTQTWEQEYLNNLNRRQTIPLAAGSKVSVCGRSTAVIAGSNPAGVTDVCRR